jgi:hypothetical protein
MYLSSQTVFKSIMASRIYPMEPTLVMRAVPLKERIKPEILPFISETRAFNNVLVAAEVIVPKATY